MKKIITKPIVLSSLGVILGILSKYGDIAYSNSIYSYFGLLSSGLLIWLLFCTVIICIAGDKRHAMKLITCLMLTMLIAYYIYSYFIVEYLSLRVTLFWLAMLIVSLILTNFVFDLRNKTCFKVLFIIASFLTIVYDAIYINGVNFLIIIPEIIMSLAVLWHINKSISKTS